MSTLRVKIKKAASCLIGENSLSRSHGAALENYSEGAAMQ